MTQPTALVQDVHWEIDYKVRLGTAWSRFMRGLAEQELWATTCGSCRRTVLPPESFCASCYEPVSDWVQLEPVGTLRAATIVYQGFAGGPEVPYAVGAIQVDGTDSLLMHHIGGVDLADPDPARKILTDGLRVRAVWAAQRSAAITDIAHFAPEPG